MIILKVLGLCCLSVWGLSFTMEAVGGIFVFVNVPKELSQVETLMMILILALPAFLRWQGVKRLWIWLKFDGYYIDPITAKQRSRGVVGKNITTEERLQRALLR